MSRINLLAIDPSTAERDSPIGAALFLGVGVRGEVLVPCVESWYAGAGLSRGLDSEEAALRRVFACSGSLATWASEVIHADAEFRDAADLAPLVLAWEAPFLHPEAGRSNVETYGQLMASVGMIVGAVARELAIESFAPIRPMEAATVYRGAGLKRPEKKAACRAWALSYWGEPGRAALTRGSELEIEAICDACSVGIKAICDWRARAAMGRAR